jgi:vancomycin permeability regulator SanA
VAAIFTIDRHIVRSSRDRIISVEEAERLENVDCILVLGCLVKSDGTPSDMLEDRLKTGIMLYGIGAAPKILMSGDHGQVEYDEVTAMKKYAVDRGVASNDVFCDHAGFSTYESIYRAKEIFGADKIIIVTQKYHLSRALYIAENLGVEAWGVSADIRTYRGQISRDLREVLARNKDFLTSCFKPEPTYLGEKIYIGGDGDVTND